MLDWRNYVENRFSLAVMVEGLVNIYLLRIVSCQHIVCCLAQQNQISSNLSHY